MPNVSLKKIVITDKQNATQTCAYISNCYKIDFTNDFKKRLKKPNNSHNVQLTKSNQNSKIIDSVQVPTTFSNLSINKKS